MDPIQAELDEFIRRLRLDDDRINLLGRRVTALHDGIRDLATDGQGGGGVSVTTFKGEIWGGYRADVAVGGVFRGTPMPDCQLRLIGHTTGNDYGTYDVPTGSFEIAVAGIDPADNRMEFFPIGPPTPRFDPSGGYDPRGGVAFWFQGFFPGATNNVDPMAAWPADGYGYLQAFGSLGCQYPIPALNWEDSIHGAGVTSPMPPASLTGVWGVPCQLLHSYAFGSCAAVPTTPVTIGMNTFMTVGFNYTRTAVSPCPQNVPCPGGGTISTINILPAWITTKTCPGPDLSTKFDCTWTIAPGAEPIFHGTGVAETVRFWES